MRILLKILLSLWLNMIILFSIQAQILIDWNKVQEEPIALSSFASTIEYIPLETTDECLLRPHAGFYLTDKYIIAVDAIHGAYLFNRENGKFIHQITKRGQGPGEFSFKCESLYGFKDGILYLNDGEYWRGIDVESKQIVEKIRKPVYVYEGKYNFISNPWPYGDSLYLGYVNNITGHIDTKLVVFNKEGVVQSEEKNYIYYDKSGRGVDRPYFAGMFYEYDQHTFFKQYQGNDTVFQMVGNKTTPHIVFKWDKKQAYYQEMPIFTENQIYMSYINENDDYLFFNCQVNGPFIPKETFYCLYDKKTECLKSTRHHSDGFVDDISGLNYCCPEFATNRELIEVISPEKWLKWEDERSKMPIQKEISLDDNPIIRIVHFIK